MEKKPITLLDKIIYKYTKIIVENSKEIFDNTFHIINNSVLVLYPPKNTNKEKYINNIIQHLNSIKISGTFFLDDSYKIFQDENKKEIFGEIIIINKDILEKIINEYYYNKPKKILGVTGSCGKTSTTLILHEILNNMNIKNVVINSLGLKGLDKKFLKTNNNTTPSWITLKRIIHHSGEIDCEVIIIEVSSHGIKENRIKDINFDGGIWSGFCEDHMEYHSSMEEYFYTKHSFLERTPIKIINENVYNYFPIKFTATDIVGTKNNSINDESFYFKNKKYHKTFKMKFFQKENVISGISLLYHIGYIDSVNYNDVEINISSRMELIGSNVNGAKIYSDQAYRTYNIETVINYFSNKKRLIVLIGGGGDRERGKDYRKNLGEISKIVGTLIVTDDNPRNEDPIRIRNEIINNDNTIINIGNRYDALMYAFKIANKNNIILILSHGDDEYIKYKNYTVFHTDKEVFKQYEFENQIEKIL